ncbi:MAG TPA: trypsin-like peptidase domain-containing protein [Marmoricola sp.]
MDDEEQDTTTGGAGAEPRRPDGPRLERVGRPRRLLALGIAGAVALAGLGAGWGVHAARDRTAPASTRWQARPPTTGRAGGWSGGRALRLSPASADQVSGLVRIVAVSRYDGSTAAGTGMVLTPSGEVVTNNHVVQGSTTIQATVASTGRTYTARLVATDSSDDVAVLQLRGASGLTTVSTDTGAVHEGDSITAVGDAEGGAALSAAPGTITALRRSITTTDASGPSSERLRGLIEVDADVVSGDSGGALIDEDGHVIGMTTAASSGTLHITGYAIPVATVLRIADRAESGVGTRRVHLGYPAFLGIELPTASTAPTVAGVLAGTPAARAGLTDGSTVRALDGQGVATSAQLRRLIAAHRPGEVVALRWTDTAGVAHQASVRLRRGPAA